VADRRRRTSSSSESGQRPSHRAEIAERARLNLSKITGCEAENVAALERSDDDTWKITVELLEQPGMPQTLDLIGSYETELDEKGKLLGYRRLRRYPRNRRGPERFVDAEQEPARNA